MRGRIMVILTVLIAGLMGTVVILLGRVGEVKRERDEAMANVKAYSESMSAASKSARVFRMTIEDLEASRDTLMMRLDSIRNAAGVKNKDLKSVHWRETVVERVDTVWLADSIFVADLDTTLDDGWVKTRLTVEHPDKVAVSVKVRNETTLIVRSRRETVKPPRRFWLFRLFQRKHTVVEVEAVEGNPHCVERSRRHIEIID